MFSLLIANISTEEKNYKRDMVRAGSSYYIKTVFALLTEVIAIYVQFFII